MKWLKNTFNKLSKSYIYIMIFMIILNLGFGAWYLVVLMEKVKTNDYLSKLIKENSQLNADISRIKLDIDKQVDLSNVEYRANSELQMEMITEVNYISVD